MKKFIIAIAILAASALCANSQEAFKHLSLGVEFGTTGPGLNFAMPVVSDRVFLKLGFNFPSLAYEIKKSFSTAEVNGKIENINVEIERTNLNPLVIDKIPTIKGRLEDPTELNVPTKANFGAASLLFQYYPFNSNSFHIVAGLYYGFDEAFASVELNTTNKVWADYKGIRAEIEAINEKAKKYGESFEVPDVKCSIGERTFLLKEKDGHGNLVVDLNIARLRPYIGFGLGRCVPGTDSRLGFQFDFGCWFHQGPRIVSANECSFDASSYKIDFDINQISKLGVYPRVSFSLNYLLF